VLVTPRVLPRLVAKISDDIGHTATAIVDEKRRCPAQAGNTRLSTSEFVWRNCAFARAAP